MALLGFSRDLTEFKSESEQSLTGWYHSESTSPWVRRSVGGIARIDEAESGADTSIYFQVFMQKGQPLYPVVGLPF